LLKIGKRKVSGKTCSICKESKSLKAFAKDVSRADGKMKRCRACDSKRGVAWRQNNKEQARITARAWILAHLENKVANDKRYRDARPFLGRKKTLQEYGLTLEWFLGRLAELDGRCERCDKPFKSGLDTQIDHDHAHCKACDGARGSCRRPDAVRGIVCAACNRLMGRPWTAANPHDPYLVAYAQRLAKTALNGGKAA
jgi:Recombination endonuclease VII